MRDTRPLCVLDVDGVIALEDPVVPTMRRTVSAYGKWRRDIDIPRAAPSILHELAHRFECVWMGAWAHTAHPALREALDLPSTPWSWRGVQFHKLPAIRELAGGRAWVWIDDAIDDLGAEGDPPDGLLVRVDPRRGIADVDPASLLAGLCIPIDPEGRPVHDTRRRGGGSSG